MKRFGFQMGALLLAAWMAFGCDDKGDDLLVDYQSHALEAQDETSEFKNGDMTTRSMETMHQNVRGHLGEMIAIRQTMMSRCGQAESCPEGGGATGDMDGSRMHGGRYLAPRHLDEMSEREEKAESTMGEMGEICSIESEEASDCMEEHAEMMDGTFDEMVDACSEMMDDHMGSSGGMGSGMMGSGHM